MFVDYMGEDSRVLAKAASTQQRDAGTVGLEQRCLGRARAQQRDDHDMTTRIRWLTQAPDRFPPVSILVTAQHRKARSTGVAVGAQP